MSPAIERSGNVRSGWETIIAKMGDHAQEFVRWNRVSVEIFPSLQSI